jgi:hypothetical protein
MSVYREKLWEDVRELDSTYKYHFGESTIVRAAKRIKNMYKVGPMSASHNLEVLQIWVVGVGVQRRLAS